MDFILRTAKRKLPLHENSFVKATAPYDSIEIQSETEPYGLTVFLKDEPSASRIEDELQVNADMTFNLIGNLGTIDYKTADSKEIIASYER